jgi:SET domain-containing protein
MEYSGGNSPGDVFLSPKDFAGYVVLINTGKDTNCKCLRTVIDETVRVIIYTSREIKAGEELLYPYGTKYNFVSYHLLA